MDVIALFMTTRAPAESRKSDAVQKFSPHLCEPDHFELVTLDLPTCALPQTRDSHQHYSHAGNFKCCLATCSSCFPLTSHLPDIQAMIETPTLVFTPGAWHQPTCYSKIIKILQQQHNIKCTSFSLPSTSNDPNATFKDDLDAACATIASETTQGKDVILVAHSYGGMVANSAIKNFASPRNGTEGRVIGLVLIASGFTLTGLSFMDPLFHIPPPSWRVNKHTGFADVVTPPAHLFYNDLPPVEAEEWIAQLRPQSLKALFEGGEYSYAGWRDVPVWYIGTTEDQGLPVVLQRVHVGFARSMGASVVHRELRSGHSPFLSRVEETVGLLVLALEDFVGANEVKQADGWDKEVIVPEVKVWEPMTWVRYGLPYAIGSGLGICMLLFYSTQRLWRSFVGTKVKIS